jgi:hypothetical protein
LDIKFGYRLANGKEDSPAVEIAFQSTSGGPLVVCEPPCFVDECPSKRKIPLLQNATITIDTMEVKPLDKQFPEVGKFCAVLQEAVSVGDHILRISTSVVAPEFAMVSHVISF